MSRIIHGILSVPSFNPTGNTGEYSFTNAVYQNQSDMEGYGVSGIKEGFILVVPASDLAASNMIPGAAHRYRLTSVTDLDFANATFSGVMVWDETGEEIDQPTNGVACIISEPTPNYRFGLPVSSQVYPDLSPGLSEAAHALDLLQIIDTLGTDWNKIKNPPTTISGYGISDAVNVSTLGVDNGVATLDSTGKLSTSQIPHALVGGMSYMGVWDASTNTPSIPEASAANKGWYYVVHVSGTTLINGIRDWQASDWIVSDETGWVKIDNSDRVSSINGHSGDVTLTTDDINQGSRQYFQENKVLATVLTGLDTTTPGNIASTDSILQAISKLETRLLSGFPEFLTAPLITFQATSRYQVVSSLGKEVWVHSSSKAYGNLSWTRDGSLLTIKHVAHGHSNGDRVIIRDANEDYICSNLTIIDSDYFKVSCSNDGGTSGISANYSMGFNYSHNSDVASLTSGTLTAPSNENVQLISMRIHLAGNTRSSTTYDLVLPPSALNGAGANLSPGTVYIPMYNVRQDSDTLAGIAATIAMNPASAGYNRFQFSAIGSTSVGIFIMLQF